MRLLLATLEEWLIKYILSLFAAFFKVLGWSGYTHILAIGS